MQRYVNDVKADIAREMELEDLRKMQSSMEEAARSFQSTVSKEMSEAESELNKLTQSAELAAGSPAEVAPSGPEPSAATAPQQRELALDANPSPPSQKHA
jgi:sec-independent protein translocase protein TatB